MYAVNKIIFRSIFLSISLIIPIFCLAVEKDIVKVELRSSVKTAAPGETFYIGAYFRIKPQWHIYWKYPGSIGYPTSIKLTGSHEIETGQLVWPIPEKFSQNEANTIIGYGYSHETFLYLPVTIPIGQKLASSVNFKANIKWLNCSKGLCVPGRVVLDLSIPVAIRSKPANTKLFKRWQGLTPVENEDARVFQVLNVSGDLSSAIQKHDFLIDLKWKNAPKEVQWFPVKPSELNVTSPRTRTIDDHTVIRFGAQLVNGQELKSYEMESIVVSKDAEGRKQGIILILPLINNDKIVQLIEEKFIW